MSIDFARQLNNIDLVENFISNTLKFDHTEIKNIIENILDGEIGVANVTNYSPTITSTAYRNRKFKDEASRWRLRKQIIEELYTIKRLNDDEAIRLNHGGALPLTEVSSTRQAFLLTGLPASGKSTIANKIADDYGAIIVDSDYAKRKLPEFKKHKYGATVVHKESSQITMGFKIDNPDHIESLYEKCIINNNNIVIPTIGESAKDIINIANILKNKNSYDVHLILVSLPRREATIRAIQRYNKTKRYVPLGLIFDGYGNDPTMTYYFLRCKFPELFKSMGCLSNDVPKGFDPVHTDALGNSPVLKYNLKEQII